MGSYSWGDVSVDVDAQRRLGVTRIVGRPAEAVGLIYRRAAAVVEAGLAIAVLVPIHRAGCRVQSGS